MQFKSTNVIDVLNSLIADEYFAWAQYYMGKIAAKGKTLNFLGKIFDENGEDELEDHFKRLVDYVQGVDGRVIVDVNKMKEITNCPFIEIEDGVSTSELAEIALKMEDCAIDAYRSALALDEVRSRPELVVLLSDILNDEIVHRREIMDLRGSIGISDDSLALIEDFEKQAELL